MPPSERAREEVSRLYTDSTLLADKSRVEPASAEQESSASPREILLEAWLQHLFAWRCDKERNVLMRMIYIQLQEWGILAANLPKPAEEGVPLQPWGMLEDDFPNPAEEGFPQDLEYDFADRPSPWLARGGGICALVLGGAESKRMSPERFIEKIFGDSISADQVFYALFVDTPPDTRGLVFPKRSDVEHT